MGSPPVFGGNRVTIFLVFCVVFCLSLSSVVCVQCYQFLWIVHSFLIAPSVFSNVYLTQSWIGNIVHVAVLALSVFLSRTYLLFNISYTGSILVKLHWPHNILLYMVTSQNIVFWGAWLMLSNGLKRQRHRHGLHRGHHKKNYYNDACFCSC